MTVDLPLMKNISDWVCDLTSVNIDGFLSMECEWFIFHTSPGRITILIDLFAEERKKRIRYPFKEETHPSGTLDSNQNKNVR